MVNRRSSQISQMLGLILKGLDPCLPPWSTGRGCHAISSKVRWGLSDLKLCLCPWARDRRAVAPPEGSQLTLWHVGSGLVRTPRAVLGWFLKQTQVLKRCKDWRAAYAMLRSPCLFSRAKTEFRVLAENKHLHWKLVNLCAIALLGPKLQTPHCVPAAPQPNKLPLNSLLSLQICSTYICAEHWV